MILTARPSAFLATTRPSIAALASILPVRGTSAVITSTPLSASASEMPRQ